ncbi:P-loop ATPase, Sll1717 family [Mesorhizobium sophorae]|uniref:P-loop ATPase, Sll1717 family n=1 Tax=Mesorhizobium sophorae TaxID=1300294 RepID=UPI000BA31050|nr:hypothetical protein [Mesorhizobium sophorae]
MTDVSFQDFYKRLGLSEYPFRLLNAENEGDKGSDLFISTSKYGPIMEGFVSGGTLIITGDRGSGKTAIILDFIRKAKTDGRLVKKLIVNISDFSGLPTAYQATDLYRFTIQAVAKELFEKIAAQAVQVSRLSQEDKVSLTYFLHHFVPTHTKAELKRKIEAIQIGRLKRTLTWCYRIIRFPANVGLNAATHFLGDALGKALGTTVPMESTFREYLPDVELTAKSDFNEAEATYAKLNELLSLCRGLGFQAVVFIMDKIDEDPRFHSAAEDVAAFVMPMVADTKFLLNQEMQVIISLWIAPFNMVKDKIRTQKVHCAPLDWSARDLEAALNRRAEVFSQGNVKDFRSLFSEDVTSDTLAYMFNLANKNPRDLWHVLDYIMKAQYSMDNASSHISYEAMMTGFNEFVQNFNYYENYPRRSNAKASSMDVYGYIKHLLKLGSGNFTRNQLNDAAGTGSSTLNYCVGMENLGLIEKDGSTGGNINYRIRDPKVVHARNHSLEIIKSNL